jgi:hypothetical protein
MNTFDHQILETIEKIKSKIDSKPSYSNYVCVEAMFEAGEHCIKRMVEMHIGKMYTMEKFLRKKWKMKPYTYIANEVVNSYRICMLNNMIKMVKEGRHK